MSWRGYMYMDIECPKCKTAIFQRVSFGNSKITCLGMEAYGEKGKGCGYKFGVNVGLDVATYKLREVDSG